MKQVVWTTVTLALFAGQGVAQDCYQGIGPEYIGAATPSLDEPLYQYDDQDVWKHGWIQINPYEHGYHSYRPYNYKQVFAQAAQSSTWGMPSTMPYSQQYYLRYGSLTDINQEPIGGGYPTPAPGYNMPTSMNSGSPLRQQPFNLNGTPGQFNNVPGLTQLPGHQFAPPQPHQQDSGYRPQPSTVSPTNFQQQHAYPAAGAEAVRQQRQKAQIQQMLQQQRGPRLR